MVKAYETNKNGRYSCGNAFCYGYVKGNCWVFDNLDLVNQCPFRRRMIRLKLISCIVLCLTIGCYLLSYL